MKLRAETPQRKEVSEQTKTSKETTMGLARTSVQQWRFTRSRIAVIGGPAELKAVQAALQEEDVVFLEQRPLMPLYVVSGPILSAFERVLTVDC